MPINIAVLRDLCSNLAMLNPSCLSRLPDGKHWDFFWIPFPDSTNM